MSDQPRRLPAGAIRILERWVPEPTRSEIIGDLAELLAADGSRLRFWCRVLFFSTYFRAARVLAVLASSRQALFEPGLTSDGRYAWKALVRAPGFTLTAIATLTFAVCAVTTISFIATAVLWCPLPFPDPESLVVIDWMDATGHHEGSTLHEAEELQRSAKSFAAVGVFSSAQRELHGDGPAELAAISYVHSGTFTALGVQPMLGRLFDARHDRPHGDVHYAVVSYALWQRRFGGARDLASRPIRVGTQPLTIIGVMPRGFDFPKATDIWVPIESFWASSGLNPRMRADVRLYPMLGRLATGVSVAQAEHELRALANSLSAASSDPNEPHRPRLRELRRVDTAGVIAPLQAVAAGVLGLLLVCCVNVASLHAARASQRRAELLTRGALGAPRGRLARTLAFEAVLPCLVAGLLGAWSAGIVLRALASAGLLDLPSWVTLAPDNSVWIFAAATTLLTASISVVTPLWFLRFAASGNIGQLSSRGATPDRARVRHALVLAQVALSTTLVAGSLMLVESFRQLEGRDVGIRTERLVTISVTRSSQGNRGERSRALWSVHQQVVERLSAVPGIERVSGGDRLPLAGAAEPRTTADLHVTGGSVRDTQQVRHFRAADVFPGYFETIGIPIVQGRAFDNRDSVDRPPVAVVNAYAAELLWPGRDPIGQQIRWGPARPDNPPATVVGVVGNVRHASWETEPGVELYYPYAQYATDVTHYIVRTGEVSHPSLAETLRKAILNVSPDTVVSEIRSMDEWRRESLAEHALGSTVLSLLSLVALALAVVGLYALIAYLASERASELAIRTSLGATPRSLTRLVLSSVAKTVAIGIGVGLVGIYGLAHVLRTWVFGIAPGDPQLVIGTSVLMTAVAVAATLGPAVRAARTNPAQLVR